MREMCNSSNVEDLSSDELDILADVLVEEIKELEEDNAEIKAQNSQDETVV